MPTALDRVQCLMQPELYAEVRTLAKHNRRTLSAMCAELVAHAIKTPTYKQQLEEAAVKVPPRKDPRSSTPQAQYRAEAVQAAIDGVDLSHEKLTKLKAILDLLEGS
mgnify:CR=1 FL=1